MKLPEGLRLQDIARIYPSVVVEHEGVETTVSLEWYEDYKSAVKCKGYELIFITKHGKRSGIYFEDFESMMDELQLLFDALKESND